MAYSKRNVSTGKGSSEEMEQLRAAFEDEGPWPFDCVTDYKWRAYDGHYVVVRMEPPGQQPVYADLARGAQGEAYQFQNDSLEFSDSDWKGLTMDPEDDNFRVPSGEYG